MDQNLQSEPDNAGAIASEHEKPDTQEPLITEDVIPENHRGHRPQWMRKLARWFVRRSGWELRGHVPEDQVVVVAAAPHTSNWDFIIAFFVILAIDLRCNILMKKSFFFPPLSYLLHWFGVIPVNREAPEGFVDNVVGRIRELDSAVLVVTPEGTRSRVENWKSGFIRIAQKTDGKILLVKLDYGKKCATLGPELYPEGDVAEQLLEIRRHFDMVTPRNPENFQPVEKVQPEDRA
ncbi:MAG: 1-acyl-sn-glycerol-3-phosphate acyltransferase [bacterium]